jgi:hypothetical protein
MKWYQLHLSTLLTVMLLASVVVWLNVRERGIGLPATIYGAGDAGSAPEYHGRGWPSAYEVWYYDAANHRYEWDWTALSLDGIFWILVLIIAGGLIEERIRRADRRGNLGP